MLTHAPAAGVGTGPADILLPPTEPILIDARPATAPTRR